MRSSPSASSGAPPPGEGGGEGGGADADSSKSTLGVVAGANSRSSAGCTLVLVVTVAGVVTVGIVVTEVDAASATSWFSTSAFVAFSSTTSSSGAATREAVGAMVGSSATRAERLRAQQLKSQRGQQKVARRAHLAMRTKMMGSYRKAKDTIAGTVMIEASVLLTMIPTTLKVTTGCSLPSAGAGVGEGHVKQSMKSSKVNEFTRTIMV
mmetsp:Transcript_29352/g.75692  ORF Transcript_29352/g.75692 Transcript_29352/m.75692 type:complete len:209 (+) Transcript_29352:674-1300(+)